MSTTITFPFNDLPIELQREVFVVAANIDQRTALRLVLVARRFYRWLQPHIYEMVTLGSDDTALFLRTMGSLPQQFFANSVKKLCLSVSVSGRNATRILRACTGVTDLAFWVDYIGTVPNRSLIPYISPLPLRKLSAEVSHFLALFPTGEIIHPWCECLTHLDIIFWTHEMAPVIPPLDRLPSLTHLALRLRHNQTQEAALSTILSTCRALKVLIIFDDAEEAAEEKVWTVDPRVVFMPYPTNVVREWEAQARQEESCSWSRAEELVRRHAANRGRS
ncbi:hypothetical protein NLJ89_g3361 [Agrocybe chaxingu]|uniref:Uncharacterized protein n=1 Tax=Agrocybe chaxingu TaxID=84603 RepID=A0A9W8K4V8_9AGAR|nr:hypothetical protein NLJ89_g3361 [Agrocybe chaxingu]